MAVGGVGHESGMIGMIDGKGALRGMKSAGGGHPKAFYLHHHFSL
jgi:hypothetical protein